MSCLQLNDKFLHNLKYKLYNHHPVCIGNIYTFLNIYCKREDGQSIRGVCLDEELLND